MPFHLFLMNFIEYHVLPKQRIWIKGAATPFSSTIYQIQNTSKKEKEEPTKPKMSKSIQELTKTLDSVGESELSKDEKKDKLKELINNH